MTSNSKEPALYLFLQTMYQDYERQLINLKTVALTKGWHVRRTFQEKISGTVKSGSRTEFKSLMDYIDKTPIQVVMVSEISRLGRRENGKENPVAKMLLQMLSIGAEM